MPSGDVEIYRGELVKPPCTARQPPSLQLTSQGCADIGICYPALGACADVSRWRRCGSLLGRALGREAPVAQSAPPPQPFDAESACIERGCWAAARRSPAGQLLRLRSAAGLHARVPMIPVCRASSSATATPSRRAARWGCRCFTCWGWPSPRRRRRGRLSGTLLAAALQNPWVLGGFALVFVVLACRCSASTSCSCPPRCRANCRTAPTTSRAARRPGWWRWARCRR